MSLEVGTESQSPPVSVIIPAYNYAVYLPPTIDSVLQQTYPSFEVIVVDDGSTDNTSEIVRSYVDPRVRYIYQENAGLSAARNAGIRSATSDYVSFLDADDLYLPGMIAHSMNAFAKLEENFAVVAAHCMYIDAQGRSIKRRRNLHGQSTEVTATDIILRTRFPPLVVAKKKWLERAGLFDESLTSSEDRDMWIRVGSIARIFLLGQELTAVRQHSQSMRRNADRMRRNTRKVIAKAFANRVVSRHKAVFWLKTKAYYHYETAYAYFDEKQRLTAVVHLLLSFLSLPIFIRLRELDVVPLFRIRALARFILPYRRTGLG